MLLGVKELEEAEAGVIVSVPETELSVGLAARAGVIASGEVSMVEDPDETGVSGDVNGSAPLDSTAEICDGTSVPVEISGSGELCSIPVCAGTGVASNVTGSGVVDSSTRGSGVARSVKLSDGGALDGSPGVECCDSSTKSLFSGGREVDS